MYYRRKLLLALLKAFHGQLEALRLQKLLFLLCGQQQVPAFEFVPYRFGCFSFQANADLCTMKKYAQVEEAADAWQLIDQTNYAAQLTPGDRYLLATIKSDFGQMSTDELIHHTYTKYPYYAIRSQVAERKLTAGELELVRQAEPWHKGAALFTIGYEGSTVEAYLNKLLRNGVRLLCDVRRNPISMKYGFSKRQLETACKGLDIQYIHLPELGIESADRQNLWTQQDRDRLFASYRERLAGQQTTLENVLKLLASYNRIALTCFERNVRECHRGTLSRVLAELAGPDLEIEHL